MNVLEDWRSLMLKEGELRKEGPHGQVASLMSARPGVPETF